VRPLSPLLWRPLPRTRANGRPASAAFARWRPALAAAAEEGGVRIPPPKPNPPSLGGLHNSRQTGSRLPTHTHARARARVSECVARAREAGLARAGPDHTRPCCCVDRAGGHSDCRIRRAFGLRTVRLLFGDPSADRSRRLGRRVGSAVASGRWDGVPPLIASLAGSHRFAG
jgi:hypothetical protein